MSSGYFALVLHAHLPFVRHPEQESFLEEDWFFEAISETYIPLLVMMQRLVGDGIAFKLTMSITPTLAAMLRDDLLRERYVRHVDLLIELSRRELERNRKHEQLRKLAEFYFDHFRETRRLFADVWQGDLLAQFDSLRREGVLEIIACAATHGLLPIVEQQSREAARAQVLIGRDVHRENFNVDPSGFWLPECAYAPGIDALLQEANIRWTILETHGVMFGEPRPHRAVYAPYFTPAGPAVFARDRESSRQVWSAQEGYPGDPAYRDFYRDIGFDLPLEDVDLVTRGMRKFVGIKYHRITGRSDKKEFYDRAAAEKMADEHARHYLEQRLRQLNEIRKADFEPIIVAPFDAELFGHWWFEGPRFLDAFIRRAHDQSELNLTTPSEYLATHPTQQTIEPATSTWGDKGHLEVWLDKSNSWIYPPLHMAARTMSEVARAHENDPTPLADRVLKQLARELLLAQASDWAFLMKTGTAREYAAKRTIEHLTRFDRLRRRFVSGDVDEDFLRDCEWRDNLFPKVNWRYYI
ncbi:MAG: 1,4-alpha-glucan branching enzyme [Verrucomicrobiota bacterium]